MRDHEVHPDDAFPHMATEQEAAREEAQNVGMDHPERPWILTQFDSWERNPAYQGPPTDHPEFEAYEMMADTPTTVDNDRDDEIPF